MSSELSYKHEAFELHVLPNNTLQITSNTTTISLPLTLKDLEAINAILNKLIATENQLIEAEKIRIQNQRQHKLF